MSSKQIILAVCLVLMGLNSALAKSCRGIEPLHSTRADVERLLGSPAEDKTADMWKFDFPEETALIHFSSGAACEEGLPGWKVPKDIVLEIEIVLNTPRKMTDMLTPGKEYETVRPAHTPSLFYYVDSDAGIRFNVRDGVVGSMSYGPTARDKDYTCGEYKYAAPVAPGVKLKSVEHYPFDQFGNIRYEDAQARLDNFAIHLFNSLEGEPQWRGYIVVYAGPRSYIGEAQYKANCYKNYLVRVRKMDPANLYVADGGFREDMEVKLYIGREDYYPPVLLPTVSPKKVKLIKRRLKSCSTRSP